MDKRSDDDGRLTALERIKREHEVTRAVIRSGDVDEIEWTDDISPQQAGLKPVWADDNGKLWVIARDGDSLVLKRLWHLV